MQSYLVGFSIYTLAMIGIIFIGFLIVKKCSIARRGARSHNNFLEIETSLSIEPRKTLHVIRAGGERILVATDPENTSFLTKLNVNNTEYNENYAKETVNETKYCSQKIPKLKNTPKEETLEPKVFKDLMKRLQEE